MQARSKWRPSSSTSPAPSEGDQVVLEVVSGLDQIVYFFIVNRTAAATSPSTSTSSLPHLQTSKHYNVSSHRSPTHAASTSTATTPASGAYTHDQYSQYRRSSRPIDIIRWMRDTINWLKLEANFHICHERPVIPGGKQVYDSSVGQSKCDICMEYKR